ncbi:MAG TPA: SDR family oxidoreductase [Flavitalea sp.]|nr:SDR family oxidoreductase [Flavitalea sp.]
MLQEKVYIVTGGAKGIGAATSELIASLGGFVVIVDRDGKSNDLLVSEIKRKGGEASAIAIDLTLPESADRAVGFATETYGLLNGLVNNAGINDTVGLESGSLDGFEQSLRKNLFHYYAMTRNALPFLKKSKGSIVNISSKTAETGQGHTSGYVAAKGAINALTREWAVELLKYSVRVNCVIPAEVWTPLYEWFIGQGDSPEEAKEAIMQKIPFEKRFTTPLEIANTIVFLLSKRSSHTTGQLIHVDGGYTHLDRMI